MGPKGWEISRKCSDFYDRSQFSLWEKAVPSSGGKRTGIRWANPDCEPDAQVLPGSGADSETRRRQAYANVVFPDLKEFIVSQGWREPKGREIGERGGRKRRD